MVPSIATTALVERGVHPAVERRRITHRAAVIFCVKIWAMVASIRIIRMRTS
jgi:hypothetical protein